MGRGLEIDGVTRGYRVRPRRDRSGEIARERVAIEGITLTLEPGTFLALLGPNGSGKSTLMRILATGDRPDSGTFQFEGHRPLESGKDAAAYRAMLGVVFQSPGLDRLLTVRENLRVAGAMFGLKGERLSTTIAGMAEGLGIVDRLEDRVGVLSGGLARRTDLCRALLGEPRLLLLDEATVGLDLTARQGFMDLIAEIRRERPDMTVVMATHQMEEAEEASRVVMMHRGHVVADGSPGVLRAEAGTRAVRVHAADAGTRERAAAITGSTPGLNEGDEMVMPLPAEAERAAALLGMLAASGAAFEVSSPTLGDVYMRRTGEKLGQDAEGAAR